MRNLRPILARRDREGGKRHGIEAAFAFRYARVP